jgi:hypothetical protein
MSEAGKKKKTGKGNNKSKKKLEARFYEQDEWNKLTPEERSKVLELKKAKRRNKDKSSSKRKASAVEMEKEDGSSDCEDPVDTESGDQAGNEFGRGAHKKKKVTISSTAQVASVQQQVRRHVMVTKTRRFVMDSAQLGNQSMKGRIELDTHADTCVAGNNTVVLDLTGKVVTVSPFCEEEFESIQDVPIATVATAYDCHETGKTYVLVINKAFYLGDKMAHTLLCPNQLRSNGLRVYDCPKQFDARSTHSIHIPEADISIPLTMTGIISGFDTRVPTQEELEDLAIASCRAHLRP